jgi:N-acetylmuramoyl-L-alanine amidase
LLRYKKRTITISGLFLFLFFSGFTFSQNAHFVKLSVRDYPDFSRVIISSSFSLPFQIEKSSSSILVRIGTSRTFRIQREAFESRLVRSFGWSKGRDVTILDIKVKHRNFTCDHFTIDDPPQLIIDISDLNEKRGQEGADKRAKEDSSTLPMSEEKNSSSFQGVKTIIIDPGHGGLENGAQGRFGTLEKDITLAVSFKLKAIIERNLAFRVVLTREKDIDVSLENRAAIANNNKADLFISVHTNSSYRKKARGSEVFFLGLNATDRESRRLAYMENNSAAFDERIAADNEDEIKMILWDMAQKAYLKQSSELAESIQRELNLLLRTYNRGIKQNSFRVLAGVACPAVLVEVAFISNPEEERKLLTEEFQNNVAQAIYRGLVDYIKNNLE